VPNLRRGSVVWLDLDPVKGHEQSGHRPALVIASAGYLSRATSIAIVLPVTTTDRGWPNHIRLRGDSLDLDRPSFAMTEQPRTIDRRRITSTAGTVDPETMHEVDVWLRDFLAL
jgi:mRNA interferase MazF